MANSMILTCGCGLDFVFDKVDEFNRLGYSTPKKCPKCRAEKNENFIFNDRSSRVEPILNDNIEFLKVNYVQSGRFARTADEDSRPFIFNNLIDFNMMSIAHEFDYREVVRCYNRMATASSDYNIMNTYIKNINGVFLYMIFKNNQFKQIKKVLEILSTETEHESVDLKAPITFANHFKADKKYPIRDNFWLDLDNDFAFCFGESRALNIFNSLRYPMNSFYDLEEDEREIVELPYSSLSYKIDTLGTRMDVSSSYIDKLRKEIAVRTGTWS